MKSTWLKTTDNCYAAQIGMTHTATKSTLDNCGPIPFLQINETGNVDPDNKRSASPLPVPAPIPDSEAAAGTLLEKRYLVNFTVGEDYAYCRSCANSSCPTVKRYPWDTSVWLQCYVDTGATNENETYWMETTDFCWVREVDFWESLFDREFTNSENRGMQKNAGVLTVTQNTGSRIAAYLTRKEVLESDLNLMTVNL
jgi:hypothetical protein